jgi:diguanylate cyclase (GGDEF)-like protein
VNFLKYLNDNHGHKTGDAAIIRCADMLRNIIGNSGEVYRIGGDEFVCMSANPIAEKILEAAENESKIDKGYPFMVACGFAQYDEEKYSTITEIIAGCDKEMYAHKQKIKSENQEFSRK